jgi:HEPN domain-containing protein
MSELSSELSRECLTRAEHDLRSAEHLLTMPDPPPESVGFHTQQCAEKAIKGFLVSHSVAFERRHDLNYLIDLCAPISQDFERFRIEADELTPYAVEYRYPDVPADFSVKEAKVAVDIARRVYTFVLVQLGWG